MHPWILLSGTIQSHIGGRTNELQCRRKNDHEWFTRDRAKLRQFKPKKQIINAWGRQNSGVNVVVCSVKGCTTAVGTERNADFMMS